MRKRSYVSAPVRLAVFSMLAFCPACCMGVELPQVSVQNASGVFHLDGRLDESFWQELPVWADFHTIGKVEHSRDVSKSTNFRVALYGDTLIFGIECKQPEAEVAVNTTRRNSTLVCNDDSVEIFLRHNDEGFYQFAVNAGGYLYDSYVPTATGSSRALWNGAWEAAVHRDKDQWSVEIAIPFAALNCQKDVSVRNWSFNVGRTWFRDGVFQSWAPVKTGFGDWPDHGRLVFEKSPPTPSPFHVLQTTWPSFLYGKNSGEISVGAPRSDATYTVRTSLRNWQPGSLPARQVHAQNIRVKEERLTIPLELTIPIEQSTSLRELILEIVEETKGVTVGLLAYTFQLPDLLHTQMDWPVYFTTDQSIPIRIALNATEPEGIASKILLSLADSAGRTVWEGTQDVLSNKEYALRIPVENLPTDLYRVQVNIQSPQASTVNWSGHFQLVPGPFSIEQKHAPHKVELKSNRKEANEI